MGSEIIRENFEKMLPGMEDSIIEKTEMEVFGLLKKQLNPEFLNRIDELIMFKPLNSSDIESIVRIQFKALQKHLEKRELYVEPTEEVIKKLVELGFDPQFGARPVKRLIQKRVLNELSKELLAGSFQKGDQLIIDEFDNKFIFRKPISETELSIF